MIPFKFEIAANDGTESPTRITRDGYEFGEMHETEEEFDITFLHPSIEDLGEDAVAFIYGVAKLFDYYGQKELGGAVALCVAANADKPFPLEIVVKENWR